MLEHGTDAAKDSTVVWGCGLNLGINPKKTLIYTVDISMHTYVYVYTYIVLYAHLNYNSNNLTA